MITCSVCGQDNGDLAVLCVSCRSYLQAKVDNLNLFETMWQLIERPGVAFKKIILSRHKNYVFVLSSLLGIALAFGIFWMKSFGHRFASLLTLVGAAAMLGIPLGLAFVLFLGLVVASIVKVSGGKATIRNSVTVISYASTPTLFSLVFVLPVEIAIFGIDFFGTNPPPMIINPQVYLSLLGFNLVAVLWVVWLLFRGLMVLSGFNKGKSMLLTGVTISVSSALMATLNFL